MDGSKSQLIFSWFQKRRAKFFVLKLKMQINIWKIDVSPLFESLFGKQSSDMHIPA